MKVWAISPDSTDNLAKFASSAGIEFTLLSDANLAVIKSWGLVNRKQPTVPHPTAVVVDSAGVVRYLRVDVNYTKRPTASELIEAID